jgi:uncharacterized protein YciI
VIVCISNFTRELGDGDESLLSEHYAFMDEQYRQGALVASGPRMPRTGGVIVARGVDVAQVERLLSEEPLARAGIAAYDVIPFTATRAASVDLLDVGTSRARSPGT